MIPTLHIHLLGDFLLLSGDSPVTTVRTPRVQSLLAYLVLHRTAPQARSHLAWRKAVSGHSHIVILSGEAGIGKTKLAEELGIWVGRQGMITVNACCYAVEGRFAYAPVIAWLRADAVQTGLSALADVWLTEIVRLLPEWLAKRPDLPHPSPLTDGW